PAPITCTTATVAADCGGARCSQDGKSCAASADCNRCAVDGVQNAKACTPATVALDCGSKGTCSGTATGTCSVAADCNRCSNDTKRTCATPSDCAGSCKGGSTALSVPG